MALSRNTRHFHEALLKLVPPLWGKPRAAALLQAFIDRIQAAEDGVWQVLTIRTIDEADTARLDVLGKVVGQPRFDFSDEEYRAVLRAKIRTNRSRGRTDDIIEVVRLASQTEEPVVVHHFPHATMWTVPGEVLTAAARTALLFLLPKARPAGVRQHLLLLPEDSGGAGLSLASLVSGGDSELDSLVTGGGDHLYSVRSL